MLHRSGLPSPQITLLARLSSSRARILASLAATGVLVLVVATPPLLGGRLGPSLAGLAGASPAWLWAAGLGFACSLVASAFAWRTAARACGSSLSRADAVSCYAAGSFVNSLTPAKLGDAVRIALFARSIDTPGRLWTAGSIYTALATVRAPILAGLIVATSVSGALPLWPVFVLAGVAAALLGAAFVGRNHRSHPLARLLDALGEVERRPGTAAVLLVWVAAATLARLAAVAAVAGAFGLPHPLLAALMIVPALDLAGVFPLTPGNLGVASGAVTLALKAQGVGMTQALTAGIALTAVETLVGLGLGAAGVLYLVRARAPRALRLTAASAAVGVAAALGATVFNLT